MRAIMVKRSKANVETDFLNVVKHKIKESYSAQLLEQWKSGTGLQLGSDTGLSVRL